MKKEKFLKMIFIAVILILFILISFAAINHFVKMKKGYNWLCGSDWVSIIIGSISSVSTIFLGYVSYWQNKVQREDNRIAKQRLRNQYQNEKEDSKIQYKIDILVNNLNTYIEKLFQIDFKILEKNFECDILDFTNNFSNYKTLEDLRNDALFYKRMISENISFVNYIYNCIVYNKYYVEDLDNCAISIVKFRQAAELYTIEQINVILKCQSITTKGIDRDNFIKSTEILMRKYLDFKGYWTIYLQNAISTYERMIYKNNLNEFLEWFNDNGKKNSELRKKIQEMK